MKKTIKLLYCCILLLAFSQVSFSQITVDSVKVAPYRCDDDGNITAQVTLHTKYNTGSEIVVLKEGSLVLETATVDKDAFVFSTLLPSADLAGTYTIVVDENIVEDVIYPIEWPQKAELTITSNNDHVCEKSQVKLTASGIGVGAPFKWDDGQISNFIYKNPIEDITVSVLASGAYSCLLQAYIDIEIHEPIVNVVAIPSAISSGESTTLTATGLENYNWVDGIGTSSEITVFPSESRAYTVEGQDSYNCHGAGQVIVQVDNQDFIPVESISLSDTIAVIGDAFQLKPIVMPANATIQNLIWTASNGIVNVDENGYMTAEGAGVSYIDVKSADGTLVHTTSQVTVYNEATELTEIILSTSDLLLELGDFYAPTVEYVPDNATYQSVNLSSSDESVVSINNEGLIVTHKLGVAEITATSKNYPSVSSSFTVTVVPSSSIMVADFENGSTTTYETSVYSDDDSQDGGLSKIEPEVNWGGTIPLVSPGVGDTDSAMHFTYTLNKGTLTYDPFVAIGIPLSEDSSAVDMSAFKGIEFWYKGNASDIQIHQKTVTDYSYYNYRVPTSTEWKKYSLNWGDFSQYSWGTKVPFDSTQVYQFQFQVQKGILYGEVWIDEFKLKGDALSFVNVSKITFNKSYLELEVADDFTLVKNILPIDATISDVIWQSSDESIATVIDGVVTAVSPGSAVITARSVSNPTIKANCVVTVTGTVAVESIQANVSSVLYVSQGFTDKSVNILVLPTNANDKSISWSSNDVAIAVVNSNGEITGIEIGTAIIEVKSNEDPAINTTFTVEVISSQVVKTKLEEIIAEATFIKENTLPSEIGANAGQYDETVFSNIDNIIASAEAVLADQTASQNDVDAEIASAKTGIETIRNSIISPILITDITLSTYSIDDITTLTKEVMVTTIVEPQDASNSILKWTSSDEMVVTVKNGLISVIAAGSATITAESTDGSSISKDITIQVYEPVVSINMQEMVGMQVGEQAILYPYILPQTASPNIVWSSSNENIATVDASGKVTALAVGSCNILAQSALGEISSVCIINVAENVIEMTGLWLEEEVFLLIEDHYKLQAQILPYNATDTTLYWKSMNEQSLVVDDNGVLQALSSDTVSVIVFNHDSTLSATTKVVINASNSPEIPPVEEITVKVGTQLIKIPLSDLVEDDKTSLANLTFVPSTNQDFSIQINQDTLEITPNDPASDVAGTIVVFVTDQDGQSSSIQVPITVSSKINEAPEFTEIPAQAINEGSSFLPVNLCKYVNDDFTKSDDINFSVLTSSNLIASVVYKTMYVQAKDPNWLGTDSVLLVANDEDGKSSTIYVVYTVTTKANEAPVISEIPLQEQTNSQAFKSINLSYFVEDDYTPNKYISWEAQESSKLSFTISQGIAEVSVIDNNWQGIEIVEFIATDNEGLSSSIFVVFNQKANIEVTWTGKPEVDFVVDRNMVGVNNEVYYHGAITGDAGDGLEWTFEGGSPVQSNSLNPVIVYNSPGEYDVTFVAGNFGYIDSLKQPEYVSVLGLTMPDTLVCSGSTINIAFSNNSLSSYEWNTGASSNAVSIDVVSDTTLYIKAQQGLNKFYDTLHVSINTPVDLGADFNLCDNETQVLSIPGFESYKWNADDGLTSNEYSVSVGETIAVEVEDEYGCVSNDEIVITQIAKPDVTAGNDVEICDGDSYTTSIVTTGTSFKWSTLEETKDITIDTTGMYIIESIADNGCVDRDTINVNVLKPFNEEIGVATFANDGNAILIAWERTSGKRTAFYEIHREIGVTDQYEKIGEVPFDSLSVFEDLDANSLVKEYKYKLVTVDSTCENSVESIPHSTVHLQNSFNSDGKMNLEWNSYEGATYNTIRILRGTSIDNLVQIDSVAGNKISWTDDVPYESGWVYRIGILFEDSIKPKVLKVESGPFILAVSNIAESQTSINSINKIAKVYPTVVSEILNVEIFDDISEATIEILSVDGEIVKTITNIESSKVEVNVSGLATGNYFVRISKNEDLASSMFIVK
jgi:uncharacterized protein YjdB